MKTEYKYLELLTIFAVCVLIVSNIIAGKLVEIGPFVISAAVLFFPLTYLLGDIFTEVYGYGVARRVFWVSLFFATFCMLIYQIVLLLPLASGIPISDQEAYERVLGGTWRVIIGSYLGTFLGSFANDFVIAKMKIWTKGKYLWSRTITSTAVSESIDTSIFYPIALYGVVPTELLISAMMGSFIVKVLIETLFTPITYRVTSYLKRVENKDHYDHNTNFNPFILENSKMI